MIKTALLTSLAACLCIAVSGAPRPETSTYVDGNVSSLKPHTGGTLVFTDNNSMTFRTGLADVAVPYANILHAELGATQTHHHDLPLPGVLAVVNRLHKTDTQLLTVEFKSGLGENQTMTLELAKPAASSVLATIQEHAPKSIVASAKTPADKAAAKEDWWGDSYWKTTRNQDSWNTKEAANAATNTTVNSK
jgi:hypothetical protein